MKKERSFEVRPGGDFSEGERKRFESYAQKALSERAVELGARAKVGAIPPPSTWRATSQMGASLRSSQGRYFKRRDGGM